MREPPVSYLQRLWFDTVIHDPATLRHLVERVGASQIVIGTDYPFDMGTYRPHEMLAAMPELSSEERAAILGLNAARLLRVDATEIKR